MSVEREFTAIDRIAEAWVDTLTEQDPITGTYIGREGAHARLNDFSPEGAAQLAQQDLRKL